MLYHVLKGLSGDWARAVWELWQRFGPASRGLYSLVCRGYTGRWRSPTWWMRCHGNTFLVTWYKTQGNGGRILPPALRRNKELYKIKFIKNRNNIFFLMKLKSYRCVFIGKINEMHILINEKSNREILAFFKITQDTSRDKIELRSLVLNPNYESQFTP